MSATEPTLMAAGAVTPGAAVVVAPADEPELDGVVLDDFELLHAVITIAALRPMATSGRGPKRRTTTPCWGTEIRRSVDDGLGRARSGQERPSVDPDPGARDSNDADGVCARRGSGGHAATS